MVIVPLGMQPSVFWEELKKLMREKYLAADAPFTWNRCVATRSTGGPCDLGDYYVSTFYVPDCVTARTLRERRIRARYRF